MSSMNTAANLSRKGLNTFFIRSINRVGALVKPNGSSRNS